MATKILRPAGAGDLSEVIAYADGSVMGAVSDNSDLTYAMNSGDVKRSLFTLEAHGLAAGTTVNSVTLYYRGQKINAANNFTGLYKRSGDGAETADTVRTDATWATYNLVIPAPGGGWTLTALGLLQIGMRLFGNVGAPDFAEMADIWVVVDYTVPATLPVVIRANWG